MNSESHIKALTTDAVDLLKGIIAIPSPSFDESEVCTHICSWMTSRQIPFERIGNNIIAENIADPELPTLMLCAHIDTVTPTSDYSFDPYDPDYCAAAEIISGLTGRKTEPSELVAGLGSNDDGASAVAMTTVYLHMVRSGCRMNLVLTLSCEEERSGKNGMTGLWGKRLRRRGDGASTGTEIDFAIVGEPTGMKAATSERGLLVIDATASGISGHAARNEGENALYKALEDIDRLRKHSFCRKSPRMGEVNLNVTQINAGTAHNVIPDRCDFVIDIRPTEKYTNEEILKELQGICRSRLNPRNLANRSSATFENSPLQKAAESLGIETFSSPTTSDWMRIDCDAVKMGPGESSRSHKKDEFVLVSEIEQGIKKYSDFINTLYEHTLE